MYEDMIRQLKQVDGVVRQREAGYIDFAESSIPATCKYTITQAHQGGCGSLLFEPTSHKLISGGQDQSVNVWDSNTGALTCTLHGCLGAVLDLAVTHDDRTTIAASSTNNLFVWDSSSGRIRHALTGHTNKVCAVDASRVSNCNIVSAACDHTIKVWDLYRGFCINTIVTASNCNAVSYSTDGITVCSGHVDGNLRLWDSRSGKLFSEVAAHSQAVTSVAISRSGNLVLTRGRDNVHNLFDVRSLEICGTFKASGNRVASNWSRSCISADDNYVAAGSADGSVYAWSRMKGDGDVSVLDGGHSSHVLCCVWGGLGKSLASADMGLFAYGHDGLIVFYHCSDLFSYWTFNVNTFVFLPLVCIENGLVCNGFKNCVNSVVKLCLFLTLLLRGNNASIVMVVLRFR